MGASDTKAVDSPSRYLFALSHYTSQRPTSQSLWQVHDGDRTRIYDAHLHSTSTQSQEPQHDGCWSWCAPSRDWKVGGCGPLSQISCIRRPSHRRDAPGERLSSVSTSAVIVRLTCDTKCRKSNRTRRPASKWHSDRNRSCVISRSRRRTMRMGYQ